MKHKLPFSTFVKAWNGQKYLHPAIANYFILFIIFLCSATAQSQNQRQAVKADSIILGNCQKKIVTFETVYSENKEGGSALYYPESTMQMFKGCQIKDVYLAIDDLESIESLKIFISHGLEEPYDYVQSVTPTQNRWNKFSLTTPFKLDGSAVYIGYMVKGNLLGYTEVKEVNEEWINQRNNEWAKYTNKYSAALYAVVEGGDKLPASNVRVKKVKMPYYTLTNTPLPFQGKISNLGTETIRDFEITYQVGENQYKEKVENVEIPSQSEIEFRSNGLKIDQEGEFDLTLTVTSVNGKPDQDLSDNSSGTVKLLSRNQFTDRKVLLELFSTEKCNNCPAAHRTIAKALEGNDRVVELCHHSGFYDDAYTIQTSLDYTWFYKTDLLHAPAHMFDRNNMYDNYPEYYLPETPIIGVEDKSFQTTCSEAMKAPAFATVNLSAERVGESGRQIRIKVNGKGILPIAQTGNDRLYVFLTEDSIYSTTQYGAAQGFYHNHTARQCVTDTWGDPINLAEGYEAEYAVELPEEWNAGQMHVVAFVGNYDASDKNNCRVYNAERISIRSLLPSGIGNLTSETRQIVREGRQVYISGGYAAVRLYTSDGKCILNDTQSKERLNLEQLPQGTYILHVYANNRQQVLTICL